MSDDHPPLITGLDHAVLVCPEIEIAAAVYSAVLGQKPDCRSDADGAATALFSVNNMSLELMAPSGNGPASARLEEIIREDGPGLKSLAFATPDIATAHKTLTRRGLAPSDITDGSSADSETGETRTWRRFRCNDESAGGLKIFIIETIDGQFARLKTGIQNVHGLDHVVINTPNPDRALGLFGAKLGLRLALDRTFEAFGARLIFFRAGGLTIEIAHRIEVDTDKGHPDTLWGFSWQVASIEAAHERLTGVGLNVSEIRDGREPGSQVFTLRDGTLNVPTLFISRTPR